jgi:hypothetical protein
MPSRSLEIHELPVLLERDVFMRTLLRELSGTLQDVIGLEESAGFISVVGQRMGDQIKLTLASARKTVRTSDVMMRFMMTLPLFD